MEAGTDSKMVAESRFFIILTGTEVKKDLVKRFEELTEEFRLGKVNGSIELHFAQGYLAKLHSKRVE